MVIDEEVKGNTANIEDKLAIKIVKWKNIKISDVESGESW